MSAICIINTALLAISAAMLILTARRLRQMARLYDKASNEALDYAGINRQLRIENQILRNRIGAGKR